MLVILSGVSGAGKDTIKKELLEKNKRFVTLPSYTDRAPRATDKIGETYNFVSKEEFERMIRDDELYEYSLHHDHYYGTSKKLLDDKIKNGDIIIKDIDVNGTENLKDILKNYTKVVTIFVRVPKEELRNRLINREDKLSDEEIELRLSRFEYEESKLSLYDYVLPNDNLEKTTNIILEIIRNEEII